MRIILLLSSIAAVIITSLQGWHPLIPKRRGDQRGTKREHRLIIGSALVGITAIILNSRSDLGGTLAGLQAKLDAVGNNIERASEKATLKFELSNGRTTKRYGEMTVGEWEGKSGIILMISNPSDVPAVDGSYSIIFCDGCKPIVAYPTNDMYSQKFVKIPAGGRSIDASLIEFTVPPGVSDIHLQLIYECNTCVTNPIVPPLSVHLVPSLKWEPVIVNDYSGPDPGPTTLQ